ncbi:hypothetical protein RB601_006869 [Gaeumannomyces tritici]
MPSTTGSNAPSMVLSDFGSGSGSGSGNSTSATQSGTLAAYIYNTDGPADRFVQPYPESQTDRLARLDQETAALQQRARPPNGA